MNMEKQEQPHILKQYLWQYRYTALMFLLYAGIFAMIFSLYRLEAEAVWYASGLCFLLTAAVLAVHFIFYRKKHIERIRILRNIHLLTDELPEPAMLLEADYQQMLLALKQIFDHNLTAWQNERQEILDYYTTWVHQIKTPISVMRMTLQSEELPEYRELAAELFSIEQYVEMALNYLRLGSSSSDFVLKEYALDDIIRQAICKYAPQFIRNKIRLVYEPTEVTVLTDEKWLLFIIEQLLSNAVKYTAEQPERTVSILVTRHQRLKISDTGIGIAPKDLPRIFEKGFTGYNGRADKKSTGLGLYLCRLTAEKLSHKIRVESAIHAGTVVTLDLHREKLETE